MHRHRRRRVSVASAPAPTATFQRRRRLLGTGGTTVGTEAVRPSSESRRGLPLPLSFSFFSRGGSSGVRRGRWVGTGGVRLPQPREKSQAPKYHTAEARRSDCQEAAEEGA